MVVLLINTPRPPRRAMIQRAVCYLAAHAWDDTLLSNQCVNVLHQMGDGSAKLTFSFDFNPIS